LLRTWASSIEGPPSCAGRRSSLITPSFFNTNTLSPTFLLHCSLPSITLDFSLKSILSFKHQLQSTAAAQSTLRGITDTAIADLPVGDPDQTRIRQMERFPTRSCQCLQMAQEILAMRGEDTPLGVNWLSKFLKRFPQLQSRFVPPLDTERSTAQDPAILSNWFQLYYDTKLKYNIERRGHLEYRREGMPR